MKFDYCPDCGTKLNMKPIGDEGDIPFCESCSKPWFPLSYVCTITIVVCEAENGGDEEFALIQQYNIPPDRFICVAGYLKPGELPEQTAVREVEEEIGLKPLRAKYMNSYYLDRKDQLMLGFAAHVNKGDFKLSQEVDNAKWFTRDEAEKVLPPNSIALNLFHDYINSR